MKAALDVVIIGGGPAGLAAALTLGRGRKRVALFDAGAPRNAAAHRVYNFVTRDGTPPAEFRRIGREQLQTYPNVTVHDAWVTRIKGARGAFEISTADGTIKARRVLLCTGMIDEMLPIEGFETFWGHAIFQCPYCHGWEHQDGAFAVLATTDRMLDFALFLKGWSRSVAVLTQGALEVSAKMHARLVGAGIHVDDRPIRRLVGDGAQLRQVEFRDGPARRVDTLFAHPPQRQVALVTQLGLTLDEHGFVAVDPMTRETSVPGLYAAGDLTTFMQAAVAAASGAMHAAAMLNHELTIEQVDQGTLIDFAQAYPGAR